MRDTFFNALYERAKDNENIIIVSADFGAPSLDQFRNTLPNQYINVGLAEKNMVTVATGLTLTGKKVFIYAILSFVTARCYEMLKVDLSLMNLPITVVGVGAGFSYHESGPTHHSLEDIAIMRPLPNFTILSPSDSIMAQQMVDLSCKISGPTYVRLDREILPQIYTPTDDFSSGLTHLRNGKDVYLISTGNMVHTALKVAESLKEYALDAGVLDIYQIKPLNAELLLQYIRNVKYIVSLEEHLLTGGLGSAIADVLVDNSIPIPLKRIAVNDKYHYAYGGRKHIQSLCKLDADSVTNTIVEWRK